MTSRFEDEKQPEVTGARRQAVSTSRYLVDRRPTREPLSGQGARSQPALPRDTGGSLAIFLPSPEAQRTYYSDQPALADDYYRRSRLYADKVAAESRKRNTATEIHEFSSLESLVQQEPATSGVGWGGVVLLTHGTLIIEQMRRGEVVHAGLWLGDRMYFVLTQDVDADLYRAIEKLPPKQLTAFRGSFVRNSELMLVLCGNGTRFTDVAVGMRDLFGTSGKVAVPRAAVGLDKVTGELGVLLEPGEELPSSATGQKQIVEPLRPLRDSDWLLIEER